MDTLLGLKKANNPLWKYQKLQLETPLNMSPIISTLKAYWCSTHISIQEIPLGEDFKKKSSVRVSPY